MPKLKIVSNPYKKSTLFYTWDPEAAAWRLIDRDANRKSHLIDTKIQTGFFPFKIEEIVETLVEEYMDSSQDMEIVFEGTGDDFKELKRFLSASSYGENITLSKGEQYLENARDVFPGVKRMFNEDIRNLININTGSGADREIEAEIEKYMEAASEYIPLCIMGNYSAGKSTFINALIGNEVLPSGAEPVTAKVFKIQSSSYKDRASIQFTYNGLNVSLLFDETSMDIRTEVIDPSAIRSSNGLLEVLEQEVNALDSDLQTEKVNRALELINGWLEEDQAGDLISIEVPFNSELERSANCRFVIFDTPGSNTASNERHLQILKSQFQKFSNGLPVFVAEFSNLDSNDNEQLYNEIKKIPQLDHRFTLVIVNKADHAQLDKGGFSKEKEKRILQESVCRNLYSSGIYFVSSILALGSKTNGEFLDDHYAEIFEDTRNKYTDPSSRFYKQLYIYNIMPEQLKAVSIKDAQNQKDLLFANSGMYSIEKQILTFSEKYSTYDKCQQALTILIKIIALINNQIHIEQEKLMNSKKQHEEDLAIRKEQLYADIDLQAGTVLENVQESYRDQFHQKVDLEEYLLNDKAYEWMGEYRQELAEEMDLDQFKDDMQNSREKKGLKESFLDPVASGFEKIKSGDLNAVSEGIQSTRERIQEGREIKKELKGKERQIRDAALAKVKSKAESQLNETLSELSSEFENQSEEFWQNNSYAFRASMLELVTGNTLLREDEQALLSSIIINYPKLGFSVRKVDLTRSLNITITFRNKTLFDTDFFAEEILERDYNQNLKRLLNENIKEVKNSHTQNYVNWQADLVSTLKDNIETFNPDLNARASTIRYEEEKIRYLESQLEQIQKYYNEIDTLIDWKG